MSEFIKTFEIENFKKFNKLAVTNIGQINLITGDNNVGKTCFLESLTLDINIKNNLCFLLHFLHSRGFNIDSNLTYNISDIENNNKNNIVALFQKELHKPIKIKHVKTNSSVNFSIHNEIIDTINTSNNEIGIFAKGLEKYSEINSLSKNWILFYVENKLKYMVDITSKYYNQFLSSANYVPLVSLNDFFRADLVVFYNSAINSISAKKIFMDNINSVFQSEKIIDVQTNISLGSSQILVATDTNPNFHSITQYGSGFVRVIRIILEMMNNQSRPLMIDEIDTGLHFLKMKDLWKIIFKLSKNMNIQIFATTHSSDCIKSLVEAGEEDLNVQSDLRIIELEEFEIKSESKLVNKATTYEYESFKFKLEAGTNIRGGDVWQ
jgi:AAA15 family ATPase/GTPase